jgi:C4-dicarboxylate transporter DctQ subunit
MSSVKQAAGLVRVLEGIGQAMTVLSVVLMVLLALPIIYDAVLRAFGYPTIWVFETTLYAFIFLAFLGNALAVKRGSHFRVTIFLQLFPQSKKTFDLISNISIVLFSLLVISSGAYFTWYSWSNSIVSSTLLEVPQWIPNLAVPLGGIGLLMQTIVQMCCGMPEHSETGD